MRLLALFFAVYFAFLACMSCADEAVACNDQTQTVVAAASHADCAAGELGDWCSPLCQCHCCGGAVVPATVLRPPVAEQLPDWGSATRHAQFVVAALTQAPKAVWQPPRA
ncbi:DUF6660 family protein [Hymenobacter jeollabukensis]|uniref:Secreted protein n=1 Tax=Hymenobacter jeollabukensis TaxID=2025313 RepID=A0A5R8WJ23_9BACT|nr:DUF6660 family protein [Hymenobacter jeollabukensis]TLM88750.1 hypothetical protein FDY95_23235 [Hymenobacter jeollabukensis]